jgi:glycerol 2-dehydrogenase (NADP+)
MHWPVPLPPAKKNFPVDNKEEHIKLDEGEWSYIDTWKAMKKLLETGKVKAIGVSNMSIPYLERLIDECDIVPAVNQVFRAQLLMTGGMSPSTPTT